MFPPHFHPNVGVEFVHTLTLQRLNLPRVLGSPFSCRIDIFGFLTSLHRFSVLLHREENVRFSDVTFDEFGIDFNRLFRIFERFREGGKFGVCRRTVSVPLGSEGSRLMASPNAATAPGKSPDL